MASRQTIGRVVVEVDPDFDAKQLRKQIAETAGRGLKVKIVPMVALRDLQKAFNEATAAKLPTVYVQPKISVKAVNDAIREVNQKKTTKLVLAPKFLRKDINSALREISAEGKRPSIRIDGKFGKAQIRKAVKEAAAGLSVHITPQNAASRLAEDRVYARQKKLQEERLENDLKRMKAKAALDRVAIAQKAALAEFATEDRLTKSIVAMEVAQEQKLKAIKAKGVADRLAIKARGVAAEGAIGARQAAQEAAMEGRLNLLRENHALIMERRATRGGSMWKRLDGNISSVLSRTRAFEFSIGRMLRTTGLAFTAWGAGIGVVFAGVAAAALVQFARVEQAAAQAASIVAFDQLRERFGSLEKTTQAGVRGVNAVVRRELIKNAQDVAAITKFGTREAAEGYVALAQAGLGLNETIATLPTVARFAEAGFLELGDASDRLVQSYITAGFETDKIGEKLPRLADLLIFAANDSVTSLEDILKAFTNRSASSFATYGQRVEETINVLNLFARAGVIGLKAGTQASIVIRELTRAANEAPDAWDKFGVSVSNANGTTRSTSAVLDDIVTKLREQGIVIRGSDGEFKTLGKRFAQLKKDLKLTEKSSTGIQSLIPQIAALQAKGQSATSELNRLTKESAGALNTQAIGVRDTLAAQFETFVNQISNLGAVFASKAGRNLTRFFIELNGGILQGRGLQESLEPMAKAFGDRFNDLIRSSLQQFRGRGGRELFRGISEGFRATLRGIQKFFAAFSGAIGGDGERARGTLESIGDAVSAIGRAFEELAPDIGRVLGALTNLIVENAAAFELAAKAAVAFWLILKPIRLILAPMVGLMTALTARTAAHAAATAALASAQTAAATATGAQAAALSTSAAATAASAGAISKLSGVIRGLGLVGAVAGATYALDSFLDRRFADGIRKQFDGLDESFALDALSELQTQVSDAEGVLETYQSVLADTTKAQDVFTRSAQRLVSAAYNVEKPIAGDLLSALRDANKKYGEASDEVDRLRKNLDLARKATEKSIDVARNGLSGTDAAITKQREQTEELKNSLRALVLLKEEIGKASDVSITEQLFGDPNDVKISKELQGLLGLDTATLRLSRLGDAQDEILKSVGSEAEIRQMIKDGTSDITKLELERLGIERKLNELGAEGERISERKISLQDTIVDGIKREREERTKNANLSLGEMRRRVLQSRLLAGAEGARAIEDVRTDLFSGIFKATKPEDLLVTAKQFDAIAKSFIATQQAIKGTVNTKAEIGSFVGALKELNATPAGNQLLTTFDINMKNILDRAKRGKLDVNATIAQIGATPTGQEFLKTLGIDLDAAAAAAKTGGKNVGGELGAGLKEGREGSVNSEMQRLAQSITGTMNRTLNVLTWGDAGRAAVGGLTQTFKDAQTQKSELTTSLHSMTQWIKDNKGPISADRTMLVPAGNAIMHGLVSGLESGFSPVQRFVHSIAGTIGDAMPESLFVDRAADFAVKLAMGETPDVKGFFSGLIERFQSVLSGPTGDLSFLHPTLSLKDTTQMAQKLGSTYGLGVSSVFRAYDTVAGSGVSQHLLGQAADLSNGVLTPEEYKLARDASKLVGEVFRQVIFENKMWEDGKKFGHVSGHDDHVHLGWMPGNGFSAFSGKIGGTPEMAGVSQAISAVLERAAAANSVSSALVKAIAKAESNFNPNAVSPAGASGLMQLMPSTFAGLGVGSNIFDPQQNANAGAKYIANMMRMFGGNTRLALAAYNAGPGAVQRFRGVPPYAETQAYVERVLKNLRSFSGFRERGGPVGTGRSYVVGEGGPELFVPRSNGMIVSNDKLERMLRIIEMGGSAAAGKVFSPTVNVQTASRDPEITAALVLANMRGAFAGVDMR